MSERWDSLLDGETCPARYDIVEIMREQERDDLAHIADELRSSIVVKNIRSERIGPDTCAELDQDTGILTILDSEHGVEITPVGLVVLLAWLRAPEQDKVLARGATRQILIAEELSSD